MHVVPSEKDGAPSAMKRPDDEVQRTEEFNFQPMWQRSTSPSMMATSGSKMEPDDTTVHQIADDSAVRKRCARSKPPT